MKSKLVLLLLLLTLCLYSCINNDTQPNNKDLDNSKLKYVNPLMGTDSEFKLSNGNTYPAIAVPWGMNFWTPMTGKIGDGWTYRYRDYKIRGIKQTHQPSPWINDYAAFSLMPGTGKLKYTEDDRASWFSHKAEIVKPHYYSVYLADCNVTAEVTPTERAAVFQFTFPQADSSYISLDAFKMGSMVRIIPKERKIIGYCKNNHGGVPKNFKNYFIATFDIDFDWRHTWNDNWKLIKNSTNGKGNHVGAIVGFKTKKNQKVTVKVASSFISHEQAFINLKKEIGSSSFEQVKTKAMNSWEKELGRINVSTESIDNTRTFYSCLYRLLLFPRKFYEVNDENKILHYSPYNGKVLSGYMFTDNGFWDTFRAVFPFFNLMYPELNNNIMKGLLNTYLESGWLPEWASPGHRDCMIGSNSSPIIADATVDNVGDFNKEKLLEALVKNATVETNRPVNSVGRAGLSYYNSIGYVPYDVGINENVARTLEYAFADFTLAQMAKSLNKDSIANVYYKKSMNYKNVFDKSTSLMRGKNQNGEFQSPFNPLKWGDAFTEGNSLHYTWSVFHDIQGLINLMGGNKPFVKMLDYVFESPPDFDDSYYGFTIHEIREMQIVGMGNYAHGNQPIQHLPYLYNYALEPWKTQEKVREIITKLYNPNPDGYCGDEDNGQTSAWYVFSAMGFYPVTATSQQYVIGNPLFKYVKLLLPNGKDFSINSPNNNSETVYIKNAHLNDEIYNKTWININEIRKGGELKFEMQKIPNKKWGTDNNSIPYSLSNSNSP